MIRRIALLLSCAALAACAATEAPLPPDAGGPVGQLDPIEVERIILDAARDEYGSQMVNQAVASSDYLVAYRGVGGIWMPAPEGRPDPPMPQPRMAMIAFRDGEWVVAENGKWRQARQSSIDEIQQIVGSPGDTGEPVHIPPCPDYPTGRLLMKFGDRLRIARDHGCPSQTDRVIGIALEA